MFESISLAITAIGVLVAILSYRYQLANQARNSRKAPFWKALNVLKHIEKQGETPVYDALLRIVSRHVFLSPKGLVNTGIFSKVSFAVFLDLFTASTDPATRTIMAHPLRELIQKIENDREIRFQLVAVPKEGNVLLADQVAQQLALPLLVVRSCKAIRFNYPIEGNMSPGSRVILVDDISSDGLFLKICVSRLQKYGAIISDACCLFERTDGNARDVLSKVNITLHSVRSVNDDTLTALGKL